MKSSVVLFVLSLFTIASCFQEDELIRAMSKTKSIKQADLQRSKRQVFRSGLPYPSAAAQSRAPTVIVVPERSTGTIPAYSNVPISPYGVNSQNRGTTVVVSQVPEYNYNTVGRTYDVVPVNPVRI